MAGPHGRRSPPPIRSSDQRRTPAATYPRAAATPHAHISDFLDLPPPWHPQRKYLGVRQRACGTWVAKITDRETQTKKWIRSFHTSKLAALEYDRWQIRFHSKAVRLKLPWGTVPAHLVPVADPVPHEEVDPVPRRRWLERQGIHDGPPPPAPGARGGGAGGVYGEVIVISDDEVQGGDSGGQDEKEFDVEEWQCIFPASGDDGTG
nr:ethylene-responsive transcription factor ABI4-like [Aegilops tauschii subsp. strangulata]